MNRIITFACLLLTAISLHAQELSVRSMEEMMVVTASIANVKDLAGNPCAEVRVSAPGLDGCTFRGTQYIGEIQRNGAEYILYMPAGEKYLYLQNKYFHELKVSFADYGIIRLMGKRSYRVIVNVPESFLLAGVQGAQQQPAAQQPQVQPAAPRRNDNQTFTVGGVTFTMVYVEGGTFTMGATSEQGSDADDDEKPAHSVTLSDYYIGQTEVTQALWNAVMHRKISQQRNWKVPKSNEKNDFLNLLVGKGDNYPMYFIDWYDCEIFILRLNSMTGRTFRIPTEAEWEYAARGGVKSLGYKYSGGSDINVVAVYDENSSKKGSSSSDYGTHTVATKTANELGLYDMSGNVYEWCSDLYSPYENSSQTNLYSTTSSQYRVIRGGGWSSSVGGCRVSHRGNVPSSFCFNGLGLRLALSK